MVISPNVTVHFPRMRPPGVSFFEESSGVEPVTAAIQTLPPALTLPWKRLVGNYARDDTDLLSHAPKPSQCRYSKPGLAKDTAGSLASGRRTAAPHAKSCCPLYTGSMLIWVTSRSIFGHSLAEPDSETGYKNIIPDHSTRQYRCFQVSWRKPAE